MKTKTTWSASDLSRVSLRSIHEFRDNKGEWHAFELLVTPDRIVFGDCCNVGFLESGYIERDSVESLDETLSELMQDLKTYYDDDPEYVSRIICNERM